MSQGPSTNLLAVPGYTPTVGALVAMLDATRASTIAAVAGLDTAALDHQHDATANPIGALLAHVASIEWFYITATLEHGPPSAGEWAEWGPGMRLGPDAWAAARGRSLDQHLSRLETIRLRSRSALLAVDDAWLSNAITLPWIPGPVTNLWAWYHVMEDELSHRGQIRWLRSRLAGDHGASAPSGD